MGGVRGLHSRLGEVRMHFDLVYRGNHRSLLQQGVQVLGHEVTDAPARYWQTSDRNRANSCQRN